MTLVPTESTTVLLHGDLHPGNVLDGGAERGLMATGPKACVGDPVDSADDHTLAAPPPQADVRSSQRNLGTRRSAMSCVLTGPIRG